MNARMGVVRWWRSASSATIAGAPLWRLVAIVGSLLILGLGVYKQIRPQYLSPDTSDFYTYYHAALALRAGENPFAPVVAWIHGYAPGDPLLPTFYVYTPFFALLLTPLTLLPLETANLVWGLLNLAFLIGAVYSFLRFARERVTALNLIALTTAASLLSVVRLELYWGQADILILFLLCAGLWANQARHPIVAGTLLAVACVTKPPMLIFLVFLLWKREYRFALAAACGFLVFLLVPFLLLGGDVLRDQLTIWSFWSSQYVSFNDNESVRGILAHMFTVNPSVRPLAVLPALATFLWLVFSAGVALLIAAHVRAQRLASDTQTLLEVGLVTTGALLVSPLTEYIYTTLLVVPFLALYVFVARQGLKSPATQRLAIASAALWALLCLPLYKVELAFANRMSPESSSTLVFLFLAVPYLYAMIAVLILTLVAGRQIGAQRLSLRELFGAIGASVIRWGADLRSAITRRSAQTPAQAVERRRA